MIVMEAPPDAIRFLATLPFLAHVISGTFNMGLGEELATTMNPANR